MSLGSSAPCDLARELARRGLARTTTSAYLVSGATQPNRTAYIVKLALELLGPLVQRRQSRTMASAHAEKTYTYTILHLQLHLSCSYVAHQRKQAAVPPFWRCENAGQQSPNVAQHPRWNNLGSCTATEQCLRSCTEMHAQAIRYNIQATCAERDGCAAKPNPSRYTRHNVWHIYTT